MTRKVKTITNSKDLVNADVAELPEYNMQEMSEFTGVSVAALYKWCSGETKNPRSDTLQKVALAMGFRLAWTYGPKYQLGRF